MMIRLPIAYLRRGRGLTLIQFLVSLGTVGVVLALIAKHFANN